jgi:hypothetical protein
VHAEIRTGESVPKSAYGVQVPRDGLESKFSLPGVCALVLLGHDLTVPASYSDANVASPAFTDLIRRIKLVGDPAFTLGTGEIVVQTPAGPISQPLPHTRDSGTVESRVELVNQKFQSLATPVIGADSAKRLHDVVLDLAALPSVEDLCDLTRTS